MAWFMSGLLPSFGPLWFPLQWSLGCLEQWLAHSRYSGILWRGKKSVCLPGRKGLGSRCHVDHGQKSLEIMLGATHCLPRGSPMK